MRRKLLFTLCALSGIALAQQVKLSPGFSKNSVLALHSMTSWSWKFPSSMNDLNAHQEDVKTRMAATKESAESQDDADAFIYLQRFQLKHSQNFADYTKSVSTVAAKLKGKNTLQRASAQVDKYPRYVARKKKETACATALEKAFTSRTFAPPPVCDLY